MLIDPTLEHRLRIFHLSVLHFNLLSVAGDLHSTIGFMGKNRGHSKSFKVVVETKPIRRDTRMGEVRSWFARIPADAMRWFLGVISAEIAAEIFRPEIAAVASFVRSIIGL